MQQNESVNIVELNRRKQLLKDAFEFSLYIPDDLRQLLEETLDADQRDLVVQLQVLAISFGRKLQLRESSNNAKLEVIQTGSSKGIEPSGIVKKLLTSNGYVDRGLEVAKQTDHKPVDILVVPAGTFDPTKKH